MIDWPDLVANSIWILGCALALATFSYASWQSSQTGKKLGVMFKQSHLQASLDLGGLLFCTGLLLTSDSGVKMLLWAILGVFFLSQLVRIARASV